MPPAVFTFAEVARELRISPAQLRRLRNGKYPELPPLPFYTLGRALRMRREALLEWQLSLERREKERQYASGLFNGWLAENDPEFTAGA